MLTIFVDRSIFVCRVHRSNYGATLSLSAYRQRAQASEVKFASFFEYFDSICEYLARLSLVYIFNFPFCTRTLLISALIK